MAPNRIRSSAAFRDACHNRHTSDDRDRQRRGHTARGRIPALESRNGQARLLVFWRRANETLVHSRTSSLAERQR